MTDLNYNSHKTKAIVLCTTPINDRTQFVHFYTEQFGRITCRIPILSRGKRANQLRMMMTPMTLLQLELKPEHKDIHQIEDAEILSSPYLFTTQCPEKAAQCMYIAELTHHVVRPIEQEPDQQLWDYLLYSLKVLEKTENGWENFHLVFTCQLISRLGFFIDPNSYKPDFLFDLTEGAFTTGPIYHAYYLTTESAKWLHLMLLTTFDNMAQLPLTQEQRNIMLDILLAFLRHHLPEIGTLNCLEIIKDLV